MVAGSVAVAPPVARRGRRSFARRLLRTRLAGLGLGIVGLFVLFAVGAGLIAPRDPVVQHFDAILEPPSAQWPLGTDQLGRDLLSRVIYGARVSLAVGIGAVGLAALLGTLTGLLAGYRGGWLDELLMSVADAMWAFPSIVLALAITATLGSGIPNLILAIGIVYIPVFARLTRSQALAVKQFEFVTAARALGGGHGRVMLRYILPNVLAPLIVQASLSVPLAIIVEAALSFIGIGADITTPTWGSMLRTGYQFLELAPWVAFAPGMAIFLAVFGFNLVGDALRTAGDPRLQRLADAT